MCFRLVFLYCLGLAFGLARFFSGDRMARLTSPPALLSVAPLAVPRMSAADREKMRDAERAADRDRGRQWYNTAAWRRLRAEVLAQAGWMCEACAVPHQLKPGRTDPAAAVVDHKTPHKGDRGRFFDRHNLWAVCKEYHDGHKQRAERAARAASGASRGP